MADKIFLGIDGDWSNANNWSPVNAPVTADRVFFPDGVSQSITAGLDAGGADLALLYLHPRYTGSIGSSASPLLIAAVKIVHRGSGGLYIESDANGAGMDINDVWIMCANAKVPVEIGGNAADLGEVDNVHILRGHVTLKANIHYGAAALVEVGYMANRAGDATAILHHNSGTPANTTIPTYLQAGGNVLVHAILTSGRLTAGILTKDTAKATALDLIGGTCHYDHKAVGGDATVVHVRGGATFNLMRKANVKTVSTVTVYPDGTLKKDDDLHTITTLTELATDLRYA